MPARHRTGSPVEASGRFRRGNGRQVLSSVEFTDGLKASSKALYRQVLEPVRLAHGRRTAKGLEETQARKILEKVGKDRPGLANLTRAVMHKVMKLARINPNPFAGIPPYRIGTHHTWTEQEVTAYEAKWPLGTRQRLAYAALLWTSQRAGDVVRMRRPTPNASTIETLCWRRPGPKSRSRSTPSCGPQSRRGHPTACS